MRRNPADRTVTDFERIVLRNQRYIMLALANVLLTNKAAGAHDMIARVKLLEHHFDWIAAPSERLE